MDPRGQISEVSVKACLVGPPRDPGGGIAFEREERIPEQVDAAMGVQTGDAIILEA
jgi:hypothetical protein